MPTLWPSPTGRSRHILPSGSGSFGVDPDTFGSPVQPLHVANPDVLIFYLNWSAYAWTGVEWERESRPGPPAESRLKFRATVSVRRATRVGRDHSSGLIKTGVSSWQFTDWYPGSDIVYGPGGQTTGSFSFSDDYTLTEKLKIANPVPAESNLSDPGWEPKRARPVEIIHVNHWSLSASASAEMHFYLPSPTAPFIALAETHSATVSVSTNETEWPATTDEELTAYDWVFDFQGLGFHFPITASYNPGTSSLESSYGSFSTARGNAVLSGSPHSCAFDWTGGGGTEVSYHNPPPSGYTFTSMDWPTASAHFFPSWSLAAQLDVLDYTDITSINAKMQHRVLGTNSDTGPEASDVFIGEWDAFSTYQYPATGDRHWGETAANDGIATWSNIGGGTITGGLTYPLVTTTTGIVLEHDLLLAIREKGAGTISLSYFCVSRSWADNFGNPAGTVGDYLRSGNRFIRGRTPYGHLKRVDWIPQRISPYFPAGTLKIDAVKRWTKLLDNTAKWRQESNDDHFGTVTFAAISGGGIAYTAAGGPALATTRGATTTYRLRYFAYRYARLRVKITGGAPSVSTTLASPVGSFGSTTVTVTDPTGFVVGQEIKVGSGAATETVAIHSIAGSVFDVGFVVGPWPAGAPVVQVARRLRFGTESLSLTSPTRVRPRYLWEVPVLADDTWETIEIDLARPEIEGKLVLGPGGTFILHYDSFAGTILHPARSWVLGGTEVWLEMNGPGTYSVEYLEGFHKTGGSRTPALVVQPLEVKGDCEDVTFYEDQPSDPYATGYVARFVTNGVISGDLTSDYATASNGSFQGWFDYLFAQLDDAGTPPTIPAKDTGLHVTKGAHAYMPFPHIDGWEIAELPYGASYPLDTAHAFNGTLRLWYPQGYYGMGDILAGTYDRQLMFHGETVLKGEIMGNAPGGSGSAVLHDNPTNAVATTGSIDADGFYRLRAPYGVQRPFTNDMTAQWSGASPPYTYPPAGERLNDYWLKGPFNWPTDSSGYILASPPGTTPNPRRELALVDRYPAFLILPGTGGGNPSNLQDALGQYHRVWIVSGAVAYRRADVIRPGPGGAFDQSTSLGAPAGAVDAHPRIVREPWGRLLLVFQRAPGAGVPPAASDVLLTYSDDDGETWSTPTVAIPGGSKPRIRVGLDGTILTAALVGSNLKVTRQDPGELSPTAPYTVVDHLGAALSLADDTFDLDQGRSGDAPWLLVAVKSGGTAPTEFQSWDEMQTVKEIT